MTNGRGDIKKQLCVNDRIGRKLSRWKEKRDVNYVRMKGRNNAVRIG